MRRGMQSNESIWFGQCASCLYDYKHAHSSVLNAHAVFIVAYSPRDLLLWLLLLLPWWINYLSNRWSGNWFLRMQFHYRFDMVSLWTFEWICGKTLLTNWFTPESILVKNVRVKSSFVIVIIFIISCTMRCKMLLFTTMCAILCNWTSTMAYLRVISMSKIDSI